jgi:hypothetical protein
MSPEIQHRVAALSSAATQVRWCDERRFREENAEGVSPGEYLNRFGWWVLGTTIGGNAIVVRDGDPAVYFADHTWYHESGVHYQNLRGDRSWISLPLTAESVRESLFMLAESGEDFVARAVIGEIDREIDEID